MVSRACKSPTVVFSTIFGSWSGGGIITFYLSVALKQVGITEPAQQAGINGGLQIFNLCVALAAASLVKKLGRRILFISSSVIMLLAMIGFTVATEQFTREGQSAASKALVAMVFLFQFGSDVGYTPLRCTLRRYAPIICERKPWRCTTFSCTPLVPLGNMPTRWPCKTWVGGTI
ncbi:Lactose permease [Colletotrichum aenigma]|uniref:Lactose permease n=1 Tax=Colletotrichum aenigma TaxID=1215731 RepID=UPI0018729CEE|nr:Lactose permease [Colletotrichum aenigma]KAF5519117.1 Lactose permease [Colletotrichum aenigma]